MGSYRRWPVLEGKQVLRKHHNTTQQHTTQHNTTQHNTTQHNTTQHNTTQHNTAQHNTTQHSRTVVSRVCSSSSACLSLGTGQCQLCRACMHEQPYLRFSWRRAALISASCSRMAVMLLSLPSLELPPVERAPAERSIWFSLLRADIDASNATTEVSAWPWSSSNCAMRSYTPILEVGRGRR